MPEPQLIYLLEQTHGLSPTRSGCVDCACVEYIYFVGVVCHCHAPDIETDGICQSFLAVQSHDSANALFPVDGAVMHSR